MDSSINLGAIYVANFLGVALMIVVIITNAWRVRQSNREGQFLILMAALTAISCCTDVLCFVQDGQPGFFSFTCVYVGNFWLYAAGIIMCYSWFYFLLTHLDIAIHPIHELVIKGFLCCLAVLLLVNFFYPCVFSIDSSNTYSRGPMYWAFLVVQTILMADSIVIYALERRKNGVLKQFPVWLFVIPAILGVVIQGMFYGISVTWSCIAISTAAVMTSLQNELLFRDSLTGLFNRLRLEDIKGQVDKRGSDGMGAIMLDLNRFKSINDTFGHSAGDQALKDTAAILHSSIGDRGIAIRYGGDEFLVIINTTDETLVKTLSEKIIDELETFNRESNATYKLSASIGYSMLDLETHSIDELLKKIDKSMYEKKAAYYTAVPEADRRKN